FRRVSMWHVDRGETFMSAKKRDTLPLAENRSQIYYAWRGPAMLVLDTEGCAGTRPDAGLFFRQTRYVRDLRLELFGESPHFCSMAEIAPNEMEFTYVYPEKPGGGSDRGGEKNG